jgi:hypothetical protein
MKLQFVGIVRYPFLRNLFYNRDYRGHYIEQGVYVVRMVKNTFKFIPRSVVYYDAFIVRGESVCVETESKPLEMSV